MHDKTIRRRRAVLALLVVISLALLTDYFGQPASSPLHSVQRGISSVLSPLQSGASTVLSPFRDAANYIGSTFSAKSKLSRYEREYHQVVNELAQANERANKNANAARILGVDNNYSLKQYGPETADVIGENPSLWYQTLKVDRGSSSGVKPTDPVIGPGGLIGDVIQVAGNYSVVSLITSPDFSVGAMIQNTFGASGVIQPRVGDPSTLMLNELPTSAHVSNHMLVVTSGFLDPSKKNVESWAPAGIPIGTVNSTNPQSSVLENQQVSVTPLADLQYLSLVQILTKPRHG